MLSKISTKDGFQILFHYNSFGDLFRIIDSRFQTIHVDTDPEGHILGMSVFEEEETKLIRYRYDNDGNMVQTTDALDVSKYFQYDGHLLSN
jgi:YD repeat-containing protein